MSEASKTSAIATSQSLIEEQAAEWLISRLHDKDWNMGKEAQLEAWLAESTAHEVAYLRLEAGWKGADRLAVLRTPPQASILRPSSSPGTTKFHVAAVLVLCAAIGTFASFKMQSGPDQVFATPVGGRETITLADGSQIELNTDTELWLPQGSRQATLVRGEAYFQIKHDASRPFTLDVGEHRIVDLGTKFVVRRKPDDLQVTLVEGRARVETASTATRPQSAILTPGDVAVATRENLTVTHKPAATVADTLSWRSGFVIFRHMTLREAAGELNRYNTAKIVIADGDTAKRVFGGKFRTTDAQRFAIVVSTALGLHADDHGTEIVISKR